MVGRALPIRTYEILTLPPCPYLAVYRDAYGQVVSQRALRPPLFNAAEALEEARRLVGSSEVVCDVFEIVETVRVGGLMFRGDR